MFNWFGWWDRSIEHLAMPVQEKTAISSSLPSVKEHCWMIKMLLRLLDFHIFSPAWKWNSSTKTLSNLEDTIHLEWGTNYLLSVTFNTPGWNVKRTHNDFSRDEWETLTDAVRRVKKELENAVKEQEDAKCHRFLSTLCGEGLSKYSTSDLKKELEQRDE